MSAWVCAMSDSLRQAKSLSFSSVTLAAEGDTGSRTPICPGCESPLTAVKDDYSFTVKCECDDPPKEFIIEAEN